MRYSIVHVCRRSAPLSPGKWTVPPIFSIAFGPLGQREKPSIVVWKRVCVCVPHSHIHLRK